MTESYKHGGVLEFLQSTSITTGESKAKSKLKNLFSNGFTILDDPGQENVNRVNTEGSGSTSNVNESVSTLKNKQDYLANANESSPQERQDLSAKQKKKKKKKKPSEEDIERLSRTLFVGNVATSVTRKTIQKLFTKYGAIETVRIRSVPVSDPKIPKKVAFITKKFHSERETMNAYIVFKEKKAAEKALEQRGYVLEGHRLRIDSCNLKPQHEHQRCVFVGNLPFNISEDNLFDHFCQCGDIDDVRVIRDKESGIGKGFAYVKFKSKDQVLFGLKLNESQLCGRKIRVTRSKENPNNKVVETRTRRTNKQNSKDANRAAFQRRTGNVESSTSGLKSTRKKDREIGKKIFSMSKDKSRNKNYKNNRQKMNNKNKNKKKLRNDKAGKKKAGK